jgi:hypothetical protein
MCRNKIKHVPESYFEVEFDRDSSQAQPAAKGENGRKRSGKASHHFHLYKFLFGQ